MCAVLASLGFAQNFSPAGGVKNASDVVPFVEGHTLSIKKN